MSTTEARKLLTQVNGLNAKRSTQDTATISLYAPTGPRSGPAYRSVQITEDLSNAFVGETLVALKKSIQKALADPLGVGEFTFDSKPQHQINYVKISSLPFLDKWLKSMPATLSQPAFDGDQRYLKKVRHHHIKLNVGANRQELIKFRATTPAQSLKKGMLRTIFENNRYTRLEDPILEFDHKSDLIVFDNYMFILSVSAFDRIVECNEEIKSIAKGVLNDVCSSINVNDQKGLVEKITSNGLMAKKVVSIERMNLDVNIDAGRLANVIEDYDLKLTCSTNAGKLNLTIDHDDTHQLWDFLRLISLDHVVSAATDDKFVAQGSKRLVS